MSERLIARLYLLGWAAVCKMPETWARWLFMVIADVLWLRHGRGVRQLEANLRRVLGPAAPSGSGLSPARTSGSGVSPGGPPGSGVSPGNTAEQVRRVSRAGMRSYLRYWLEVFRLGVIPPERIMSGMRMEGVDVDVPFGYMAAGRGVIFALPHMGNYEQAGAWIVLRGAGSFTTVVEHLASSTVFEKFLKFRESLGMEVIPHAGGADPSAVLAQRLREGRLVCLVCDRDLGASGIEVEFFGEKAKMAAGPAALAVETGAALMPATLWFEGSDWGTRIYPEVAVPPGGDRRVKIAAMSQQMARAFEQGITEHPQDWHMLHKIFVADLDPARLAAADVSVSAGDRPPTGEMSIGPPRRAPEASPGVSTPEGSE
jgi:phosphatidylinositol dimannoside acyltransferase